MRGICRTKGPLYLYRRAPPPKYPRSSGGGPESEERRGPIPFSLRPPDPTTRVRRGGQEAKGEMAPLKRDAYHYGLAVRKIKILHLESSKLREPFEIQKVSYFGNFPKSENAKIQKLRAGACGKVDFSDVGYAYYCFDRHDSGFLVRILSVWVSGKATMSYLR